MPRHRLRLHLGRRPAAARSLARHGDLRGARARPHHAPPRGAAAVAGHLCGTRDRAGDRAFAAARGHHCRAHARACVRRRPARCSTRDCAITGVTTPSASSRRTCAIRASGQHQRIQDDGEGAAFGRHRGDPRRRLQPHGRRQPARPDAVVPRHRQCLLLSPEPGEPALLHGLHRHGQHAQPAASACAAAHHGQPALLGAGDARRRLPLRPGLGAGARAATTSIGSAPSSTPSARTRCCRR